jgi:tetratricopeptide (TPR) repeat protein
MRTPVVLRAILFAAAGVGCALLWGCHRQSEPDQAATTAASAQATAQAVEQKPTPGLAAYNEAKDYILSENYQASIVALERAVEQDPDFAEAWYQLGASRTHMAIRQVRYDEQTAVRLFREGVDAKRTAKQLMSLGKYFVWDEPQRTQAWSDLSKALEDVDAVLADEPSLIAALRMWDRS